MYELLDLDGIFLIVSRGTIFNLIFFILKIFFLKDIFKRYFSRQLFHVEQLLLLLFEYFKSLFIPEFFDDVTLLDIVSRGTINFCG